MKAGHYVNWGLKALEILQKFHSNMYHENGEPNDEIWNDDLNGDERILDQVTTWGKDEVTFEEAAKYDDKLKYNSDLIKEYLDDIKMCRQRIKKLKQKKLEIINDKQKYLEENNLDYKTIEKRLTDMYPELAP